MQVKPVPIAQVLPYARNPRRNAGAVAKVAASLKEFGWQQPIVVDSEMVVIAGHTRLEAARSLGMATVPVHVATELTPQQVKAYRIADNRVGEEAEWDDGLLSLELADLKGLDFDLALTGFSDAQLGRLLVDEVAAPAVSVLGSMKCQVVVTCKNEQAQGALCERLEAEGYLCRLLTL